MKTPTASHYLHGLLAPNGASDGDGWCVAEESNVDARGGETGACGGDGQVACGLCGAGEGGAWRVRQEACIRAARTYGIQHSAFSIQHSAFSTIVPRHCTHTAMNLPCNPLAHSWQIHGRVLFRSENPALAKHPKQVLVRVKRCKAGIRIG